MALVGQPVTAVSTVVGGGGSNWSPQAINDILDRILGMAKTFKSLKEAQGGQVSAQDSPQVIHSDYSAPAAPQKCKVEAGLENLYALTSNLVNAGHGDVKLSSLLDINTLTIRDAMQFIGKVIGR
jgi:hypothetical protein